MRKTPSLRNKNSTLLVRVGIDGKDAFVNCLGRWDDTVAVAKAHAIDDATRLAYVGVRPDEKQATTVGGLVRAVAWFA